MDVSLLEEPELPVTATPRAIELALVAAQAAADKLATDVTVIDVSERLAITDCFVLASAPNERQVNAVVDEIELRMREAGAKPIRREGEREGRWVLLDFAEVVVHVQPATNRNCRSPLEPAGDPPAAAVAARPDVLEREQPHPGTTRPPAGRGGARAGCFGGANRGRARPDGDRQQ